jgi:6-phosphogluconolactonase
MSSSTHHPSHRLRTHLFSLLLLTSATLLMTACGSFFQCEGKPSCPTTSTPGTPSTPSTPAGSSGSSTAADYAYVANSVTGIAYMNGYTLSSGTLTATTSSPYSLSFTPTALAITPAGTFLYASTDSQLTNGTGYIYGYKINSGGALSILGSGSPLVSEDVTSLAISPDGNWLFCLDSNGLTLEQYSINPTTGALTFATTYGVTGATNGIVTPSAVKVSPTGEYVAVALGTGGAETFAFNTSTGVGSAATLIQPANSAIGIYSLAADSNNYLYCVGTDGLEVFTVNNIGDATLLKVYPTGNGSNSVAINSTSTYVYVGNESDSTITGYSIGTDAALTAVPGSPFSAPTNVSAVSFDNSGAYLLASGYNTISGTQLYTVGSKGALTSSASAPTGVTPGIPTAIATTP